MSAPENGRTSEVLRFMRGAEGRKVLEHTQARLEGRKIMCVSFFPDEDGVSCYMQFDDTRTLTVLIDSLSLPEIRKNFTSDKVRPPRPPRPTTKRGGSAFPAAPFHPTQP